VDGEPATPLFPEPIPASQLTAIGEETLWLWESYLSRGDITLLSAYWKAGKSTLLAHLVRALEQSGEFCGRAITGAPVLYVTEESQSDWAYRRDDLGLSDNAYFLVRPFRSKPSWSDWHTFLNWLRQQRERRRFDLLVFDTLSGLWPVRDENDAAQVQAALMPLRDLGNDVALLLVHHLRKGDGVELTASRGSGALPAYCDTLLELRRFTAGDYRDTRRNLTAVGRKTDPSEDTLQLKPEGYVSLGDSAEARARELTRTLIELLPNAAPGMALSAVLDLWPGEARPNRTRLYAALNRAVETGEVRVAGNGRRGDPFTYWTPTGADGHSVSVPAIWFGTDTESNVHGEHEPEQAGVDGLGAADDVPENWTDI
jgi:hypothetical protein